MIGKFILKRIVAPIVIVSATAVSAVLGFTGCLSQHYKGNNYAKWMAGLDDNTSLREVNMPGSHDTMALYSIGDLAGQCQTLGLEDQLNIGIRFLDIRLQEVNNELKAVHGFIDQRASFESIVITVESFLKNNSGEFIIMSIKEEEKSSKSTMSFEECLKQYIKSDKWLTSTSIPNKLGDVRGKIAILSRYSGSTIGIPAYDGWTDNSAFTLPNNIRVQDHYKLKNTETKKEEIKSCFNDTADYSLKINFLSGYLEGGFPPSYAPSVANDINQWINNEIKNISKRGIVLYDFVTSSLMKGWFE